jgi:hypothetical protein
MKLVPASLTQKAGRLALTVQKQSPHLLFAAGVAGIIGSTVLACRATMKLGNILDDAENEITSVKTELKHRDGQYQKDLAYVYTKNTMEVVRLYAPAVILGTASIAAITGSHIQLTRRNTALTAAYATVSAAYDNYRERVRHELGEDREQELYHGATIEKIKIDGKTTEIMTFDPNKLSQYARFFDESSYQWNKNAEINKLFILAQQNYLNDLLHARGHVFLNEAYDALGLERSKAGQVVGWIIGDKGDNYIDFGLYEDRNARFTNGVERSILLDFNVDGVVFDKI